MAMTFWTRSSALGVLYIVIPLIAGALTRRALMALATVVGVLVEVPVMLSLVAFANRTRSRFPA